MLVNYIMGDMNSVKAVDYQIAFLFGRLADGRCRARGPGFPKLSTGPTRVFFSPHYPRQDQQTLRLPISSRRRSAADVIVTHLVGPKLQFEFGVAR